MTGEVALDALALANARAACDRAADELAGALALDPLPVLARHALASALRSVALRLYDGAHDGRHYWTVGAPIKVATFDDLGPPSDACLPPA